ncbi:MAG TPA: hypothetical protein VE035_05725 [Puia sp.]|nr:hypothetical protein [Puia sp.]
MNKIVSAGFAVFLLVSCSPKIVSYSSQISVLPSTEGGTIFLRCSGMGADEKKSYENAIYNAFSTMLFQGVPESAQSTPMIPAEDASRARPKVDKCLSDNNCYRNFITQISQVGGYTKVKGGYAATADIKINIGALRTYLEQNNIIRKFGL